MGRRKKLTNNSGIPQHEIENIARILLPDILAFYESEEVRREFAEWQAARDGAKTGKAATARTSPDAGYKTNPRYICS